MHLLILLCPEYETTQSQEYDPVISKGKICDIMFKIVKLYFIRYQSIQRTTCILRNLFHHCGNFECPSILGTPDEQSLHNGYVLVHEKSFKMGIFFNPQHTHLGKLGMKLPPWATHPPTHLHL